MKNKNAFTLIEILTVIAGIGFLAALLLPALIIAKEKQQRQEQTNPSPTFNVGDKVYIDGLNITGIVVYYNHPRRVDILVSASNGVPVEVENLNPILLKKVQPVENWK